MTTISVDTSSSESIEQSIREAETQLMRWIAIRSYRKVEGELKERLLYVRSLSDSSPSEEIFPGYRIIVPPAPVEEIVALRDITLEASKTGPHLSRDEAPRLRSISRLATVAQIAATLVRAFRESKGERLTPEMRAKIRSARKTAKELYGESSKVVTGLDDLLGIKPITREKTPPDPAKSDNKQSCSYKLRETGFDVDFQTYNIRDIESLEGFLFGLCKEIECRHAKLYGSSSPYASITRIDSSLSTHTDFGPILIDPEGNFRGRINHFASGYNSISSTRGPYGKNGRAGIFALLFGSKELRGPDKIRKGVWTIVSNEK